MKSETIQPNEKIKCKYCGDIAEYLINTKIYCCSEMIQSCKKFKLKRKSKCKYCGKEFSKSCIPIHEKSCINPKNIGKFSIPKEWKISNELYECQICHKQFSIKGMVSHYYRIHTDEGKRFVQEQKPWKNVINVHPHSWNAGKTKYTNEILKKISIIQKIRYKTKKGTFFGKSHSRESRQKMRESAILYIRKQSENEFFVPRIGKYETEILNEFESISGFSIIRNHQLLGYFPDGFIKELSVCVEIDEPFHENIENKERDIERQSYLEDHGFLIYRVSQDEWIRNKQFVIDNFKFFIDQVKMEK